MVPEVTTIGPAREVPALSVVEPQELLVAFRGDENGGSGRDQVQRPRSDLFDELIVGSLGGALPGLRIRVASRGLQPLQVLVGDGKLGLELSTTPLLSSV